METFAWIIGLFIAAWVSAMGVGLMLRTEGAKRWFGDMLEQNSVVMTLNGIAMLVIAAVLIVNSFFSSAIDSTVVRFVVIALIFAQLLTLFMMFRNDSPMPARVGPMVLTALSLTYLIIG